MARFTSGFTVFDDHGPHVGDWIEAVDRVADVGDLDPDIHAVLRSLWRATARRWPGPVGFYQVPQRVLADDLGRGVWWVRSRLERAVRDRWLLVDRWSRPHSYRPTVPPPWRLLLAKVEEENRGAGEPEDDTSDEEAA